jgi:hypothetical protein
MAYLLWFSSVVVIYEAQPMLASQCVSLFSRFFLERMRFWKTELVM